MAFHFDAHDLAAPRGLGRPLADSNSNAHVADSLASCAAGGFTSVARCAQRSASAAFAIDAHRGAGALAPEWITLIPAANFKGFDGRGPYRLDQPAHVVAATEEMIAKHMTAGLPLDFDHATDFAAPEGRQAPKRERFEARDKEGGVWIYDMRFVTRTVALENVPQPNFPLLTKAQAFEEQGQTTRSVAAAPYTFNSQNLITLPNQNLSAVSVTNPSSGAVYAAGVDYMLDAVNGIITRLASGTIPANATVNVAFSYADVVTAIFPGGSAPTSPAN